MCKESCVTSGSNVQGWRIGSSLKKKRKKKMKKDPKISLPFKNPMRKESCVTSGSNVQGWCTGSSLKKKEKKMKDRKKKKISRLQLSKNIVAI